MTLRPCITCGKPTTGSRCPAHGGNRRAMTTSQRGYGAAHQQRRRVLLAAAIGTRCPLCLEPMRHDQRLDLDHSVPLIHDARSIGDRIVHSSCNRGRAA